MAVKTITLTIDPQLEEDCSALLAGLGLNIQTAFDIFMHQVCNVGGLPFEVRQPNMNFETLLAVQECEEILAGKRPAKVYNSSEEMFAELDAEDDDDI